MVKRGDIWLVQLDPAGGRKIGLPHPCVVVSPPEMLDHLRTVLVAPMSSKALVMPFRVPVTLAGVRGSILLEQLRAVDTARLVKRLGAVSAKTLTATLDTLQEMFAQ